jgi:hypothetical protein
MIGKISTFEISIDFYHCPICKEPHEDLKFTKIENTIRSFFTGKCPKTNNELLICTEIHHVKEYYTEIINEKSKGG